MNVLNHWDFDLESKPKIFLELATSEQPEKINQRVKVHVKLLFHDISVRRTFIILAACTQYHCFRNYAYSQNYSYKHPLHLTKGDSLPNENFVGP